MSNKIIELRKKEKIRGTYLSQFLREISEDGKLHPFFDLHNSRTYRSTSSSPNFQNIPVRDEQAKKVIRSGLLPSPGNCIAEVDYSGIEVKIAACYTKDENLVKYVSDPSTDMHRDTAADIWLLPKEEVTSRIRYHAKNGWVFPQFYGDWYKSCASVLWETCLGLETVGGVTIADHLKSVGLGSYQRFENHCRMVEDSFWNERFCGYKQWKDDINSFYRRRGYIETFLGFRYTGYMDYKQVTNYPIQGTAFHCLLWSLVHVAKWLREHKAETRIIGQIHDSIVLDLVPGEKKDVLSAVKKIMTQYIRDRYSWIIVPLEVEFEVTGVDQSWYHKKKEEV